MIPGIIFPVRKCRKERGRLIGIRLILRLASQHKIQAGSQIFPFQITVFIGHSNLIRGDGSFCFSFFSINSQCLSCCFPSFCIEVFQRYRTVCKFSGKGKFPILRHIYHAVQTKFRCSASILDRERHSVCLLRPCICQNLACSQQETHVRLVDSAESLSLWPSPSVNSP